MAEPAAPSTPAKSPARPTEESPAAPTEQSVATQPTEESPAAPTPAPTADESGRWSRALRGDHTPRQRLLMLFACTALAFAQPMLSLFGVVPIIFALTSIYGLDLVLVGVIIAFGPPLVLWAIGSLVGRISLPAGRFVYRAMVWVLLLLAAIPIFKFSAGITSPALLVVVAALSASLLTLAYFAVAPVSQAFHIFGVLPFIALAAFLLASPAAQLIGGLTTAEPVAAPAGERARTPVVFLLLDELPTKSILDEGNTIDRDRYPRLAELTDQATWYRHFTTTATLTQRAAPAFLTGRDGDQRSPIFDSYPESLFTLLAPTHELVVSEAATKLCPYDVCAMGEAHRPGTTRSAGFGRFLYIVGHAYAQRVSLERQEVALDFFEEGIEPTEIVARSGDGSTTDLGVERLPKRLSEFLGVIDTPDGPALYFLHMILPHQPWQYFEDGRQYKTIEGSDEFPAISRENADGPWIAALTEQRHLIQGQYADGLVGRVLDRLKEAGVYDDALIIVAADHGISFELDTQIREVVPAAIDSVAYTPLIIKYPMQEDGRIDDGNVMATDLVPTIADVLGLEVPEGVTGAAIGSDEQTRRDGTKQILDLADDFSTAIRGTVEFDDDEHFPDPFERWIVPGLGDDPLAVIGGFDHLLGKSVTDLTPAQGGGTVAIDFLAEHESPGEIPEALVVGRTTAATEGVVAITVDGVIVTGSPLYPYNGIPGSFAALLPQQYVSVDKTLGVVLIQGDEVVELTLDR